MNTNLPSALAAELSKSTDPRTLQDWAEVVARVRADLDDWGDDPTLLVARIRGWWADEVSGNGIYREGARGAIHMLNNYNASRVLVACLAAEKAGQ